MHGIGVKWPRREPEPQATRKEQVAESVAASTAQAAFEIERREVLALLGFETEAWKETGKYRFGCGEELSFEARTHV